MKGQSGVARGVGHSLKILVSAGPTREYLDPVRFISNPSSGRMGYAVAAEALRAGHDVTLVTGPTGLRAPEGARVVRVERAREMLEAIKEAFPGCDALIMAAAVGDYEAVRRRRRKLHKRGRELVVRLRRTPDILGSLARRRRQVVIGFAAETEDVIRSGRRKLREKGVDMIVANEVGVGDAGFGKEALRAVLLYRDGEVRELGRVSKVRVARLLVKEVERLWRERGGEGGEEGGGRGRRGGEDATA